MKNLNVHLVHIESYARVVNGTICYKDTHNEVKHDIRIYDNGSITLGSKLCVFEISDDVGNALSSFVKGLLYMAKRHPDKIQGIPINILITINKVIGKEQYSLYIEDTII